MNNSISSFPYLFSFNHDYDCYYYQSLRGMKFYAFWSLWTSTSYKLNTFEYENFQSKSTFCCWRMNKFFFVILRKSRMISIWPLCNIFGKISKTMVLSFRGFRIRMTQLIIRPLVQFHLRIAETEIQIHVITQAPSFCFSRFGVKSY